MPITHGLKFYKRLIKRLESAIGRVSKGKIDAKVRTIPYRLISTLSTVMISIVFASLIIHEFDNNIYNMIGSYNTSHCDYL